MTTDFDPSAPPPPEAFRESRRRDPDPYGLDRPPMSRAEIAAANRDTEARNSDARMEREVARANALVPQRPPRSVAQHPMTPKLSDAGEIGATVLDLVRYRHAEGALSRALSRIDEESRELSARIKTDNLRARTADAASAALDAAEKREKVPPTLTPLIEWQRDRIDHVPLATEQGVRTAIERGAAERAEAAVVAALAEVDAAVIEEARKVLRDAAQAHERLNLAGLTVDVSLDDIVDGDADDGAVSSIRLWRSAVSRWDEVQRVRQWVAAVLDRGFEVHRGVLRVVPPPRVKVGDFVTDEQAREHNSPQAEARTQGSQWEGSTAPRAVGEGSSHTALRWWCGLDEGSRPAPRGVADLVETGDI
ncbi:hypothetical protein [Gordonia sp. HS-NH1]|uniref:hypothetical protein n=1 Tax=Gordonia sp. HS-NH1 TaxID=1435068 RepID=UPI0006E3B7CF|nr:hypothetical protein [Gordonia sp. HS-NH1]